MNKIYKVIWSKAKHTYVVASEIAKGHTKGETTGRGLKKLAAALLVAAALMGPNFAWAADTTKVEPAPDGSATAVEVYTKEEANNAFATIENVSTLGHTVNTLSSELDTLSTLVNTLQSSTAKVDADGKVAKAVAADSAESATKAEQDGAGNVIISTYATKTEVSQKADASTVTDEASAREAGDKTLNDRITAVKEHVLKETGDNYVSKADVAVQDAGVVKVDKKIGENVTALGKGLYDETAARIGADAAQDKVIKQVNDNLVASVNTINKNVADGFTALNQADANELAGRVAADKELVKATNGGLALNDKNVLQKNETIIAEDGTVKTTTTAADTLIMNEGKTNQITLSENGIKVGLNSGVMDKDGFYAGGDTADAAKAAMSADGKIKGANGAFTVDENGNVASKATITGETVTDGKGASMSNGTVTGKTLTDGIATITNGNINTSGSVTGGTVTSTGNISAVGDIHAGGAITGASASIQGALTAGSATITGDLTAGGAIQGKSISDGTATMQNGNITGVKNLSAETITTSGDATIGGDLTVNGQLNVDEIDLTKSGIVGDNNVTASTKVAAGEITSYKKATSTKDGSEKESAIDYDENSTSTWAKATDADGNWNKSTLTVEGSDVTSKVVDSEKNSNLFTQTSTQSQSTLTDKDNNTNVSTQTASESSSVVSGKDGEKTYKSYITQNLKEILQKIEDGDGHVLTSTEQTETDITNTAKNGTIANEAKDITNHATENMTNTVGGKLLNDVTGDMENKVGGNLITTVSGTSTETVTGKKTETYNDGLETTVTGEEKHTVNGSQTNSITGDQVNTIGGKQTTTVTGDVTEDYKANLSTTVGGSQTTTVIGDSSLTAENINNTAKNKITNKALDVETDAASSIVSKVSNDAGSNTSTQLSYQTKEEMSQADGKTASYLRGAAEEKSQLTDGAKKTTIDTVAGQTNTNITDGTNISNSLQKADQAASSVTDGTNTTVVNQDAKSLASSITDGAKANNTNSTVDKSEQLIKASDTQYSATSKTATKMEDALVSGGSVIDVIKNLDDAANPLISSAVTDGTNNTGVTQTAKDITNAARNGTITNEAKDLVNTASENMTNNVGKDLTTTVGGEMKTTVTGKVTEDYKSDLSTKVGGDETHAVTGNQTTTVSGNRTVNVKGTETENFNAQVTSIKTDQKTSVGGNQTTTVTGDSSLSAKNITNTASEKITNLTGDNTVTSDTDGTTFENKAHNTAVKEGTVTKTTISGNTITTGEAVMDYADVMKDLGVRGNAAVDGNTTLGKEGAETTLTVNSTSTFNKDVTMEKNLGVTGTTTTDTLHVTSTATFDDIVTMKKDLSVGGNVDAASYTVKDTDIKIDKKGINAGGTKVTGLAPADISHAGSTDAVSGGQLYETNTRVSGLETRMGTVETKVDKLDGKIDKVGANAAAMANLHPLEFDEDSKWNIAAAVGSSGSETASAVGVFYRPNENVMVNASAAMGTGENMFGGGVSLRLGHGGNKAKEAQMKAAAAENKELRAKVDDLTARMDALLSVLNSNMSKDFPDVPENHWAYEAVSRLAGNGIVEGYEDGKYHGERQMTRYEMAEIIYNALSKGAKAEKKLVEEFRPELQAMAAQKKA